MTTTVRVEPRRRSPLGWAIVAALVVLLAIRTIDVLLVLFLAVIIGVYLQAFAAGLVRRLGMPPATALGVAALVSLGALVGVVLLIAPAVGAQVQDLVANLPQYVTALEATLARLSAWVPGLRRPESAGMIATASTELLTLARHAALPYLTSSIEIAIEAVSVAVMALYLARHPSIYRDGVVALVPPPRRPLARVILADLRDTLRAWVVGQLLSMTVLAVLTGLGLWALGVPYALAFAAFAGVAAIVPFFGVLLSTLLPALFALGVGGITKSLAVLALGVGVHLVEANVLAPLVMERQVNVPPVLTIAGVLLIGKLFGFAGLVVAVPILAVAMVLVRHILLGEVYGDPVAEAAPTGTKPADAPSTVTPDPPRAHT